MFEIIAQHIASLGSRQHNNYAEFFRGLAEPYPSNPSLTILGAHLREAVPEFVQHLIWVNCEFKDDDQRKRTECLYPVAVNSKDQDAVMGLHKILIDSEFAAAENWIAASDFITNAAQYLENPEAFSLPLLPQWIFTNQSQDTITGIDELPDSTIQVCRDGTGWIAVRRNSKIVRIKNPYRKKDLEGFVSWLFGEFGLQLEVSFYWASALKDPHHEAFYAAFRGSPAFKQYWPAQFLQALEFLRFLPHWGVKVNPPRTDAYKRIRDIASNEAWFDPENTNVPHKFPSDEIERQKLKTKLSKFVYLPNSVNPFFYDGLKSLLYRVNDGEMVGCSTSCFYTILLLAFKSEVSEVSMETVGNKFLLVECQEPKGELWNLDSKACASLYGFFQATIRRKPENEQIILTECKVLADRFSVTWNIDMSAVGLATLRKLSQSKERQHDASDSLASFIQGSRSDFHVTMSGYSYMRLLVPNSRLACELSEDSSGSKLEFRNKG